MNTLFMIMIFIWLLTQLWMYGNWKTRNVRTTHCHVSWNHIIFANVATCFFEFFMLQHCVLTKYIYELPPCALCRCRVGCFVTEVKFRHLRIYLRKSISMNCAQNLIALIGSLKAKQPIAFGEFHRNLLQISTIRLSPPPRTSYIHPLTVQILTSL